MNFNQLLIFLLSDINFDYNFSDLFYCLSQDEETIFKYLEYFLYDNDMWLSKLNLRNKKLLFERENIPHIISMYKEEGNSTDDELISTILHKYRDDYLKEIDDMEIIANLEKEYPDVDINSIIDFYNKRHLMGGIYLIAIELYENNLKETFYLAKGFESVINGKIDVLNLKNIIKGPGIDKFSTLSIIDESRYDMSMEQKEKIKQWLLEIVGEMEEESNFFKNLHIFWTGSEFLDFNRQYVIDVSLENEVSLPTASTCFNQLHLVDYSSKETLQEKLLLSVEEGLTGFGMA